LPLQGERAGEVVVRLLGNGDVQHHALPVHGVAFFILKEDRLVADPHGSSVRRYQAVLPGVGLSRVVAPPPLRLHALAVIGMERLRPPFRIADRDLGRIAEQLLDERTHVGG